MGRGICPRTERTAENNVVGKILAGMERNRRAGMTGQGNGSGSEFTGVAKGRDWPGACISFTPTLFLVGLESLAPRYVTGMRSPQFLSSQKKGFSQETQLEKV